MQIIGSLKCRNTKKCRLWFDARGISYHFVDLNVQGISPRELKAISDKFSWDEIINREGKVWREMALEWKEFDPEEEIFENPMLLNTPIVRELSQVFIGFRPEKWKILF